MDQPSIVRPSIWKTPVAPVVRPQLSKIAASILSLPPTSAAVERSFCRHAWIHSARRNRLTTDRAAELVLVHITSHRVTTMCWIVEEKQAKQTQMYVWLLLGQQWEQK